MEKSRDPAEPVAMAKAVVAWVEVVPQEERKAEATVAAAAVVAIEAAAAVAEERGRISLDRSPHLQSHGGCKS